MSRVPEFTVISGQTVHEIVTGSYRDVVAIIERAYLDHGEGASVNPPSYFLRFPDRPEDRIIALPASLAADTNIHGLKWISSFPGNIRSGLPRASAVLILNDPDTGYPVACLESSIISASRTAASAALAAAALHPEGGRPRPRRVCFIGTGLIARYIHAFLRGTGWEFDEIGVFDAVGEYATAFADHLDTPSTVIWSTVEEAITHADLVVFATTAGEPHVHDLSWFAHNPTVLHISLRDLSPEIILASTNILDDVEHCLKANTSPHLAAQRTGDSSFVTGTLYDVLRGEVTPPTDRPLIFSPFGLGVLDLALGKHVWTTAIERRLATPVPNFFWELSRYTPAPTAAPAPADGLTCPRCGRAGSGFGGCATCRADGLAVNLAPPLADLSGRDLASFRGGPWGWPDTLRVPAERRVSLGEGNTPTFPVPGAWPGLWVKYEGANPTGSHKDRAMAAGVAKAVESGADTVIAASSGNAGASAAAYAAAAGLRCVVLTTTRIPSPMRAQILAYGATLAVYSTVDDRSRVMAEAVATQGWYPLTSYTTPSTGGNAYANEGYKSIAYELARDLGENLGAVVVPTSRADLLSGVARGFRELRDGGLLRRTVRLVAAETATGAPLAAAMRLADRTEQERVRVADSPSPAISLGEDHPTWQGLHALWGSSGDAIAIEVDDYLAERAALARRGLFLETSSAVGVAAARLVASDVDGLTVAIGTATGLKQIVTDAPEPDLPTLETLLEIHARHCR
jgi:ornithine cyclodeaminase